MAVRNFYVDIKADGRETPITGGSRLKDGGMSGKIYIRNEGDIDVGVNIDAREQNGQLILRVWSTDGQEIVVETTR